MEGCLDLSKQWLLCTLPLLNDKDFFIWNVLFSLISQYPWRKSKCKTTWAVRRRKICRNRATFCAIPSLQSWKWFGQCLVESLGYLLDFCHSENFTSHISPTRIYTPWWVFSNCWSYYWRRSGLEVCMNFILWYCTFTTFFLQLWTPQKRAPSNFAFQVC